jgi:hypothetical protein
MPAPRDLQIIRLATCQDCPELTTMSRCRKCGCFMTLKVTLKGAQCPLNKWPDIRQWMMQNSENVSAK